VDGVFWALVAWAMIFAPIGLLAMVVQDSADALNPLFLLGSMGRVLLPYLGLLLLVAGSAGLVWQIALWSWVRPGCAIWLQIASAAVIAYSAFVLAHVLGRFYWRYRERLDWGL
jgi:hypothetical protein